MHRAPAAVSAALPRYPIHPASPAKHRFIAFIRFCEEPAPTSCAAPNAACHPSPYYPSSHARDTGRPLMGDGQEGQAAALDAVRGRPFGWPAADLQGRQRPAVPPPQSFSLLSSPRTASPLTNPLGSGGGGLSPPSRRASRRPPVPLNGVSARQRSRPYSLCFGFVRRYSHQFPLLGGWLEAPPSQTAPPSNTQHTHTHTHNHSHTRAHARHRSV